MLRDALPRRAWAGLLGALFWLPGCEAPVPERPETVLIGRKLEACRPGACGPYWFEEGDPVHFTVACAEGEACDRSSWRVAPLPPGARFDEKLGTFIWTPGLDQAAVWHLSLLTDVLDPTPVTLGVADRFDAPANVPPVDLAVYTHEYGLPVIHLTWHSEDPAYCLDAVRRDAVPAEIRVGARRYEGTSLRCRGATSLAFPKKSFSLRFTKEDPFQGDGPLAAFSKRRRLVLTQTFDDNSQLRTRLAFELWNRLDARHLQLAQGAAIVFIDGAYHGLYQVTDDVDDHLLGAQGLNKDGNLYKGETHDADLRALRLDGTQKEPAWLGYEKSEGEPADDFSDLEALLTWVSTASDADFEAEFDTRLAAGDFIDWHVLLTAIAAADSYGKNSYLFHDPATPQARWRFAPWDMNHSFGQDWLSNRYADLAQGRLGSDSLGANGLWARIAAIPALRERVEARYDEALAGPLQATAVVALLDELSAGLAPSAARDERRWEDARRAWPGWSTRLDFTDFEGELAYIRAWVTERWGRLARE